MKTIGLSGGMSWESTTHYYRRLNQLVAARLGGLHSARLLLLNVEFAEVVPFWSKRTFRDLLFGPE